MSRREDIDNAIWSDPDFAELGPHAKLVYVWSFTNQRCGMSGLYKTSLKAVAFETGIDVELTARAFEELQAARFVLFDGVVLWVRTRVKHLRSTSPMIAKSIANDLAKLPAGHQFVADFLSCYQAEKWLATALDAVTLSRPSREAQVSLSGTSAEVPGLRQGLRSSRTTVGREVDARTRELCELLSESCRRLTSTPPSSPKYRVTSAWLADMDRLVRIDRRAPDEIERVIERAHADPFWRRNILSPRKLREHFDRLALAAATVNGSAAGRSKAERERDALGAYSRLLGDAA